MFTMATLENIRSFSYEDAVDWLSENHVDTSKWEDLETLEEMIKFIQSINSRTDSENQCNGDVNSSSGVITKSQAMMQHILAHDKQMKEELTNIYHAIIKFMETGTNDEIRETIECRYPDYRERIAGYQSELSNNECPIVVAGTINPSDQKCSLAWVHVGKTQATIHKFVLRFARETSAGKSSLLNLILGTEVLPYSLLCATSTICRLHNDSRMRFEVDGQEIPIEAGDEEPTEALRKKLRPFVNVQENRESEMKQVDIYWPIPMLPRNVTIVDTPGFGESEKMNERLMKYLPNAVAFIYVINSSAAGGVQEDKLLHIINQQKEWESDNHLFSFDYKCILFVCNKWDQVEKAKEEDKVWKDTLRKLTTVFPNLPEDQVFKMCTTEALRYQKSGLGNTEKFDKLLQGIEQLVPLSLKTKLDRHYRWLEKFIGQLQTIINARIAHAQTSEEEKAKLHAAVSDRLNRLNLDSERVKRALIEEARAKCDTIVETLNNYLHSEEVIQQLSDWKDCDGPEILSDFEVTRYNANKKIANRMHEIIKKWELENKMVDKMSQELTDMFAKECRLLGQQCKGIDLMIEGVSDKPPFVPENPNDKKPRLFTGSERFILLIAAPLWVPLVAAASFLFLTVGCGMVVYERLKHQSRVKNYTENKAKFMKNWAEDLVQQMFTEVKLRKFIFEEYFKRFECKIEEMCSDFIPKQIELDRKMINAINEDRRTSHEILGQFLPIQRKLKAVLGQLYMYRLRYNTDDMISLKDIEKGNLIGSGSYSDVYEAVWIRDGKRTKLAMKELRYDLRGDTMYTQLKEVDSLRSLKHKNIVEFYGVSYEQYRPHTPIENTTVKERPLSTGGKLVLLFEFCEDNLENIAYNHDELKCGQFNTKKSRYEAFKFFVTMAVGICEGLAYIHGKKYMHRDLKLANILVKDGCIPKICDLGFAKEEFISSGTFVGTVTHMSPELLNGRTYTHKTDLYSLGILLWELWYGKTAFSGQEYAGYQGTQLLDVVKTGLRPKTRTRFAMTEEVEDIVTMCWDKDPNKRMEASMVGHKLRECFMEYHNKDIDI